MLGRILLRGSGRESSEQEISSGRCAEQQQQPSCLQIPHCWYSFQESLVGGDLRSQLIFHEMGMPQRGAQDHHSLVSGRQVVIPSPKNRIGVQHSSCLLEDFHARRFNAPSIPHLGFPLVNLDSGVMPQLTPQNVVDVHDSLWPADDVNVIQKREQLLLWSETLSHSFQSSVLPHCEQGWHQRIALFTAFPLGDLMNNAEVILPNVRGSGIVELRHEGQDGIASLNGPKSIQHGSPGNEVECSDPVHGKHRCCVVQISKGLNDVRHAFDSRSGRQRVLVRRCGLLHCGVDLLCDRASHQPTESVSHHNSADPS